MRVAFIQKDPLPDLRVQWLAAAANFRGHRARAFIPAAERDLVRVLREYSPGCIVFHVYSGFEDWALEQAATLREATGATPILFVGQYGEDHPEIVLNPAVDLVLQGDSEETIPDLLFLVSRERPLRDVPGTVEGRDGVMVINPPREPVPAAQLPQPDLEIYRRYRFVRRQSTLGFAVSRGTIENTHAGFRMSSGELARRFGAAPRHSAEDALRRLHLAINRRPFYRRVAFRDDGFVREPEAFLFPFLERYAEELERPFSCVARVDQLGDEVVAALGRAGCDLVKLGIESGDEQLREAVIGAPVPDEQVRRVCDRLRGAGIRFQTVSFLGLPGETEETAQRTLALNVALRPAHAHAILMEDRSPNAVTPELERLWRLLPIAARFPALESTVRGAVGKDRAAMYGRLFQAHHDVSFLLSGEMGPVDIARIALGMRRSRLAA